MTTTRIPRGSLLTEAITIAKEYQGNLTLRQLYYQLVARGHSPNSQQDYNRIKDLLVDARIAGDFSFSWLIDRSRTVHHGDYLTHDMDVQEALDQAAEGVGNMPFWYLNAARWHGQRTHVSVWVEKEALAGVFERPCKELGVSWFACKGYPSLSALYDWVQGVHQVVEAATENGWGGLENVTILYFGDHDPDGWQIPRSALKRVEQIQQATGLTLPPVTLKRVALNMDQIEAYTPPPFPAKMTSSRYAGYVKEHKTTSAWELDALTPPQLQKLIRDGVGSMFDVERYRQVRDQVHTKRDQMRLGMKRPEWFAAALDGV